MKWIPGQNNKLPLNCFFFRVDDDNKLLYEICFDDGRASAIYTTHTVDLADKGKFCKFLSLNRNAHRRKQRKLNCPFRSRTF